MRRAAITVVLVGGCGINPQPEPPVIDISQLALRADRDAVSVTGVATNATAVRAIAFGAVGRPVEVPVNADGTFTAVFNEVFTDDLAYLTVRLDAFNDSVRSAPVEIVSAGPNGETMLAPDPLNGCVTLSVTDVDFGSVAVGSVGVQTVRVQNSCDMTDFSLETTYSYGASYEPPEGIYSPAFTGVHRFGIALPPLGSRDIVIAFTPSEPGLIDDYMLVDVRNGPPGDDIPDDPLDPPSANIKTFSIAVRGTGQ